MTKNHLVLVDRLKKFLSHLNMSIKKLTLRSIHDSQLEIISEKENQLDTLKNNLGKLFLEKKEIESLPPPDRNYRRYNALFDEIHQLEKQIKQIPNNKTNYFLDNGKLLHQHIKSRFKHNDKQKISIADIFNIEKDQSKNNKTNYYKKYLSQIDPNYVYNKQKESKENFCDECQTLRVFDSCESRMVCETCGSEITIIMSTEKPSLKDPPPDIRYYEYKRYGHFCDWLANLQGKECSDVPKDIIKTIRYEISRNRMDINVINEEHIKKFLKKYKHKGYDHYYDHASQILYKTTGIKPIAIPPQISEDLKILFLQIQDSYDVHKPKGRSNFSSYPYIIYKLCQLLGYTKILPKLKLLKDKDNIYKLDQVWKKICKDMGGEEKGWKFIPTYG